MPLIWIDGSNWEFNAPDFESNNADESQLDSETLRRKRLAEQWRAWGENYSFESINLMSPDFSSHRVPSAKWLGSRKRARNIEDEEHDAANDESIANSKAKRREVTTVGNGDTAGENDKYSIGESAKDTEGADSHNANSPTAEEEQQTEEGELKEPPRRFFPD